MDERFNKSLENYRTVAFILKNIFERKTGVNISEDTFESWVILGQIMRIADYSIDSLSQNKDRSAIYAEINNFLEGKVDSLNFCQTVDLFAEMATQFRKKFESLSDIKKRSFIRNLNIVFKVGEQIRDSNDSNRVGQLRRIEGQATNMLYMSFLPDTLNTEIDLRDTIVFVNRIARLGSNIDSIMDLKKDYEAGETRINPTFGNKLNFLNASVFDGINVLKEIEPGFVFDFIKSIKRVADGSKNKK